MLLPLQMNSSFWMTQYGDDKTVSSPEWSEKVVSRSEGSDYGDLTFILVQDTHYGIAYPLSDPTATTEEYYASMLVMIEEMNDVVGEAYPAGISGNVATPALVIHPGDVVDDSEDSPTAYNTFISHFGSDGTDGTLNYPSYLTRGNHDKVGEGIPALIVSRYGDYMYRFEYGGIHFICLDTFAQGTGEVYKDSNCPQAWLQHQLELIGKNDRIILFQHYDYETASGFANVPNLDVPWWSTTDADELLTLIEDYNVIAILHGHNHGTTLPGDEEIYEPFRGYNIISAYNNHLGSTFFVIRITDTKFQAAHWNPYSSPAGWIDDNTQSNTITSRVPYSADKTIPSDDFGSDKEIT